MAKYSSTALFLINGNITLHVEQVYKQWIILQLFSWSSLILLKGTILKELVSDG